MELITRSTFRKCPDPVESNKLIMASRRWQLDRVSADPGSPEIVAKRTADDYCSSDSDVHHTRTNDLLMVSDLLADDPMHRYDDLAAEARIEYLLHNNDNQCSDHLEIVYQLLEYASHTANSLQKSNRIMLLRATAPLFLAVHQKNYANENLDTVTYNLQSIIDYYCNHINAAETDKNTIAEIAGMANEMAVLLLLIQKFRLYDDTIVLPAFIHQDNYKSKYSYSSTSEGARKNAGFDIALYDSNLGNIIKKIQVKTSHHQPNIESYEYQPDIAMVYARDIAHEFLKYNNSSTPVECSLFRLVNSAKSEDELNILADIIHEQIYANEVVYLPNPRDQHLGEISLVGNEVILKIS